MRTGAGLVALAAGLGGLAAAFATDAHDAGSAASQDWPPFVLVAGLLALGLVVRDDGLFDAAGGVLARTARGGGSLFVGAAVLVAIVTAVLNLDTAVAFLTPVVVVAARRRGVAETPFLYLAVFMANAASLLLPGSNLTNLIVLGAIHHNGRELASAMVLPWIAAVVTVGVVVALLWHRELRSGGDRRVHDPVGARGGAGALGVVVVVVAMLVLAPPGEAAVAGGVGAATVAWRTARGRLGLGEVRRAVNLPVLAGLFAVAVDLGVLGRAWSGPAVLLAHTSTVMSAVVGAVASVVLNNLPAASLFAARPPANAHALLIGLNIGPNLAVSGALSAVLWLQAGRAAGASPSPWRYSAAGIVVAPAAMAVALVALLYAR